MTGLHVSRRAGRVRCGLQRGLRFAGSPPAGQRWGGGQDVAPDLKMHRSLHPRMGLGSSKRTTLVGFWVLPLRCPPVENIFNAPQRLPCRLSIPTLTICAAA